MLSMKCYTLLLLACFSINNSYQDSVQNQLDLTGISESLKKEVFKSFKNENGEDKNLLEQMEFIHQLISQMMLMIENEQNIEECGQRPIERTLILGLKPTVAQLNYDNSVLSSTHKLNEKQIILFRRLFLEVNQMIDKMEDILKVEESKHQFKTINKT